MPPYTDLETTVVGLQMSPTDELGWIIINLG